MSTKPLILALLLLANIALAEVPSEIRSQFEKDMRFMMETRGTGNYSEEQISAALTTFVDRAIKQFPTAFEYTAEEIEAFRDD